ncbi:ExbD/TolR family protein [Novilysobacter spongiicola]|uniref:Biopolymer transport protein ExbD n=1 Tax=Lysobacter spongiicola DSM 21749 TaxID=1122188 RepID=A0A1T4LR92_9GAMM|nr:biopolymer transporter ExbD [Lysobacter spongiicola]SJZ57252.1 biopolymer transport protein ExbD [Lysobacter spongiicola DSM 21749]
MRIRDHRAHDEPEISLIPLIDVLLVMIIFFVVTATFDARSVIKLELPRATGEQVEANQPLVVLVNAQGRFFVDDREVLRDDLESLKSTIVEVAGSDRQRPVMLRADARTPYQAVVTVYDALGQLGFRRIMSATAPAEGGDAPTAGDNE